MSSKSLYNFFCFLVRTMGDFSDDLCIKSALLQNEDVSRLKKLKTFVMLMEDKRFYFHQGYDPLAICRAFIFNFFKGTKLQGGTTITEQIVKIKNNLKDRSISTRILKLTKAIELEKNNSKEDLFWTYLSSVKFGKKSVGINNACQNYFSCNISELTVDQCFFLAERICRPNYCDPRRVVSLIKRKHMRELLDGNFLNLFDIYGHFFGDKIQTAITKEFLKNGCFGESYGPCLDGIEFTKTIRQIKTKEWICGMISQNSIHLLKSLGIKTIISLSLPDLVTLEEMKFRQVNHYFVKLDHLIKVDKIKQIIEIITQYKSSEILIHCVHGAHRSAAVAALVLSLIHNQNFIESMLCFVNPHPVNLIKFIDFIKEKIEFDFDDIDFSQLAAHSLQGRYGFLVSNHNYLNFLNSIIHSYITLSQKEKHRNVGDYR